MNTTNFATKYRSDRAFIGFNSTNETSRGRLNLQMLCKNILEKEQAEIDISVIMNTVPKDPCIQKVVQGVYNQTYNPVVLHQLAEILHYLDGQYPISQLIPFRYIHDIQQELAQFPESGKTPLLMQCAPELSFFTFECERD